MTDKLLERFIAVANHGSNVKAARALGLSQSTISRAIKKLEKENNTTLFVKGSRPRILTESGAYLKKMYDEKLTTYQRLSLHIELTSNKHIRIVNSFPSVWSVLSGYFKEFHSNNPGTLLNVNSGNNIQTRHALTEKQLDFAVMSESVNYNEYRIIKIIDDYEWGIAVPSGVPITKNRFIEATDIKKLPVIMPGDEPSACRIRNWYSKTDPLIRTDYYADIETLKGLIGDGYGIAFVPMACKDLLEELNITVYICRPYLRTALYIYSRRKSDLNESASYLHDIIAGSLNKAEVF